MQQSSRYRQLPVKVSRTPYRRYSQRRPQSRSTPNLWTLLPNKFKLVRQRVQRNSPLFPTLHVSNLELFTDMRNDQAQLRLMMFIRQSRSCNINKTLHMADPYRSSFYRHVLACYDLLYETSLCRYCLTLIQSEACLTLIQSEACLTHPQPI